MSTPHTVFVIPYRDRLKHKNVFELYINRVMKYNKWTEGVDVEIFFTHQCDKRPFNRGGMKNMGLHLLKEKYPDSYGNITIIFHDIDSIPVSPSIIPYKTTMGTVSHYYGFTYVLGGILAIKASDFERVDGFPCFWGWGLEDNALNDVCISSNIKIDRTIFFDIRDNRISRLSESSTRIWSKTEGYRHKRGRYNGYSTLKNIKYTMNNRMMNVSSFTTDYEYNKNDLVISNGDILSKLPIIHPSSGIFSAIRNIPKNKPATYKSNMMKINNDYKVVNRLNNSRKGISPKKGKINTVSNIFSSMVISPK
jgi:hypothetical protein